MATPSNSRGRKSPIVLLKWKRPVDTRQAIWDALRGAAEADGSPRLVAVHAVSSCLKIDPRTVSSYFAALIAGGFMEQRGALFTLIRDNGIHAPRLRADGTLVEQGNGRMAAWRAMRVLKRFTPRDVHLASGAAESDVKSFIIYLAKARYLRVVAKSKPGRQATYALVKDTGPKAPQVTRLKCVFDPNTNSVAWPTAEIEAEARVEGQP